MASPDFALPTLKAVHNLYNVHAVFTRPDAPKGRGQGTNATPIKQWAQDLHIPIFEPKTKTELEHQVHVLKPTLILVIAYGMILPKTVTETYTCLNGHGSILPQYRGASPIHASLLNGDTETGITIIKMNEKMDEGDIVSIKKTQISSKDTLQTLHDTLSILCQDTMMETLQKKNHTLIPQLHEHATYCQKLSTADREIHPSETLKQKLGKIRAFSPKPGAFIMANGKVIKLLEATEQNGELLLITVQPEGKKPMSYHDYKLGNKEGLPC